VQIVRRRALAVAAYLAMAGRPQGREQLMAIFWPDRSPSDARADLRRMLHVLRRSLGDDWLITDADHVRFGGHDNLWLDVNEFRRLLETCTQHGHPSDQACDDCLRLLAHAADLYRDDFLAGFSLPDSPAFDTWQFLETERLRAELAGVLARLVQGHRARDNHAEAISVAHRWLALDPLDEENHRRLMELYAERGQQTLAGRQYEQCVRLLQQELDAPPSVQTEALHRAIQARPALSSLAATPVQVDHENPPAEPAPALDEIRLLTALSVGLMETGYDDSAPALDQRIEDAQKLLEIANEAAAPYAGQVQSVTGEDLLIFFGADRVHEDDAERAVRTALTIMKAAAERGLGVQASVNSGMAYCRRPTGGEPSEFTVMGPVVNLATRLHNRAGAGKILVGAGAFRPTSETFDYEEIATTLPGIEGPAPAYRVQRLRARPTKVRGIKGLSAALIGRDEELQRLHGILTDVAEAGQGHLAAIVADAGVGKSRLIAEVKALADPNAAPDAIPNAGAKSETHLDGTVWLEGRGQAFTASSGYWLFTDMVRDYLSRHELSRQDVHATAAIALSATLQRLQRSGHLSRENVEEMGPLLGRLLSVRFDSEWDDRLANVEAEQIRRRTLQALQWFFQALAAEQTLILVCEDLHWSDPLSLDLIGALMETLPSVPLLILCVYRPQESQADGQLASLARHRCPQHFTELRLQALTEDQSRQLVVSLLAVDALPPPMRQLITEKAEGNPLFLEEIVRTLIDGDVLYRDGTRWRARHSLASVVVPASLQSVILSRVDRLEPAEMRYLQAAAVLGRLFRPRLVDAMTSSAEAQAGTLDVLVEESLVHQERGQPGPEYSFHHVLVRDAIYQDLPRGYRVDLHRRAALAIELHYAENLEPQIDLLARHYDLGDDAEKAIHYLLLAGQQAQRIYLNQEASIHYKRAVERLDALDTTESHRKQRLEALHALGELQTMLDNLEEAETYLRQAITLATELDLPPRQQVHYILSLCQFYASTGNIFAQIEQAEHGLALIAGLDAPVEFAALTTYLATAFANRGDWRSAIFRVGTIIDILPELPYSADLIDVWFHAVLWCRLAKQPDRGFDLIDPVIDEAVHRRDFWSAAQLYLLPKLFLYEIIGDSHGALTTIAEAERFAEVVGDKTTIRNCQYWLSVCHGWLIGNLAEAERYAMMALEDLNAMYSPSSHVFAHTVLGLVHYCRHDWPQALIWLEHSYGLATSEGVLVDGVRRCIVGLAWTYAKLERKAEGLALLSKIAGEEELHIESWPTVACALAGLEPMCADADEYETVQHQIMAAREQEPLPLVQWRLTPAKPDARFEDDGAAHRPGFWKKPDLSAWTWHDQLGDCSYWKEDDALIIGAANYHDLWLNNFAAPRMMRTVEGDFAVDLICTSADTDHLPLGGLLLWQNRQNYLRLTWNTLSPAGIELLGCVDNVDGLFGIGHLPGADRVHLRLERIGSRVRALCSPDGDIWYSAGEVDFPMDDPAGKSARKSVGVGPLAIGMIHRYVHAGAWTDGTAIRFESLCLWQASCVLNNPKSIPAAKC